MVEVGPGVVVTAEEANFIFERLHRIKEGEMEVLGIQAPSSMKINDLCTLSRLLLNKDFEEVPSFEEEGAGGVDLEEENQPTDFMAKFANTLALFESEPKVGKQQFLINPKTPFPQTRSIPVIGAKRRPPCSSTIALDDLLGIKSC